MHSQSSKEFCKFKSFWFEAAKKLFIKLKLKEELKKY
jgi:hypothetical protein